MASSYKLLIESWSKPISIPLLRPSGHHGLDVVDVPVLYNMQMSHFKNLTGLRSGKLVALRPAGRHTNGRTMWLCQCDCGNSIAVETRLLRGARTTKSCGCARDEANKKRPIRNSTNMTHGESGRKRQPRTPEYLAWVNMRYRCYSPQRANYSDYGGRGITVCDEWRNSFEAFLQDMGRRPTENHSLERVDNSLGYSPENCRWATHSEQAANRRDNRKFIYQGSLLTITSIARKVSRNERTVNGWLTAMSDELDVTEYIQQKLLRPSIKKRLNI